MLATCTFKRFASLFDEFDELLFFDWEHCDSPIDLAAKDQSLKNYFAERAREMLEARKILVPPQFDEIDRAITLEFGSGIHKKVFGLTAKHLMNGGSLLRASELDALKVSSFLEFHGILNGYRLIVGRNRSVHQHHNNLLIKQISDAIRQGYTVINATFPSPRLQELFPESYVEVDDSSNEYGFTIALMESASMSYIYGNAGGSSIHMLTGAPITLVGPMNWVNSHRYSYRGVTLLKARRKAGLTTLHTFRGISPIDRMKYYLRILRDFFSFLLKNRITGLSTNNQEIEDKGIRRRNANGAA